MPKKDEEKRERKEVGKTESQKAKTKQNKCTNKWITEMQNSFTIQTTPFENMATGNYNC